MHNTDPTIGLKVKGTEQVNALEINILCYAEHAINRSKQMKNVTHNVKYKQTAWVIELSTSETTKKRHSSKQ